MLTRRATTTTAKETKAVAASRPNVYDTSDTESVVTQRAYDEDLEYDSDYEEKVGHGPRRHQSEPKRLASLNHAYIGRGSSTSSTTSAVTRLPTRRPDPNVSNRNALMARENRKRKKEQMEQLELENSNLHRDLKKLQKVIDRQEVMIRGLRNERNYLKSVLENQADLVNLLKRLQPGQGETTNATKQQQNFTSSSGASPHSTYSDSGMSLCESSPLPFDLPENNQDDDGTTLLGEEFQLFDGTLDDFPLISTDVLFSSADPFAIEGGDLLNFDADEGEDGKLSGDCIRSEHNYVNAEDEPKPAKRRRVSTEEQVRPGPGICLHIGGGKVSLEFCAKCHENANKQWHVRRV